MDIQLLCRWTEVGNDLFQEPWLDRPLIGRFRPVKYCVLYSCRLVSELVRFNDPWAVMLGASAQFGGLTKPTYHPDRKSALSLLCIFM